MADLNTFPPEVREYFKNGSRKIKAVVANSDFTLSITFDNGEIRIFDMTETLKGAVFAPIRQFSSFKRVFIDDCGSIAWDIDPNVNSDVVWSNRLDICPDSCYIYSTPATSPSVQ